MRLHLREPTLVHGRVRLIERDEVNPHVISDPLFELGQKLLQRVDLLAVAEGSRSTGVEQHRDATNRRPVIVGEWPKPNGDTLAIRHSGDARTRVRHYQVRRRTSPWVR